MREGWSFASRNIYYGVLAIVAILYAAMQYLYPPILDDLGYMAYWRDLTGSDDFSIRGLYDYASYLRQADNGRISNILAPFSTIIGPWNSLFPLLTGCMTALVIHLSRRMACINVGASPLLMLAVSWTLILFLLPWNDFIFSADFALNYIWGAAVTLSFVWLLVRIEQKGWTLPSLFIMSAFAIVAGGWHEGFAFSTAFGLILLLICRRGRFSPQFYTVLLIYLAAALIFFMAPAMLSRVDTAFTTSVYHGLSIGRFLLTFSPLILLFALGVVSLCLPFRKDIFKPLATNPFCMIAAGAAAAGYTIAVCINATPRAYLWADIATLIIALSMIAGIVAHTRWLRNGSAANYVISFVLCALCIAQGIFTLHWLEKYRAEYEEILASFRRQNGGTVFRDVIQPRQLPYFTLKIPPQTVWTTSINYYYIRTLNDYERLAVVPASLEKADLSEGTKIPGNIGAVNLYGNIVATRRPEGKPSERVKPEHVNVRYTDSSGQTHDVVSLEIPFVTNPYRHKDGSTRSDTLLYYRLEPSIAHRITEFSFIGDAP